MDPSSVRLLLDQRLLLDRIDLSKLNELLIFLYLSNKKCRFYQVFPHRTSNTDVSLPADDKVSVPLFRKMTKKAKIRSHESR